MSKETFTGIQRTRRTRPSRAVVITLDRCHRVRLDRLQRGGHAEDQPGRHADPGGEYLLIFNMGGGIGILHKKWLTSSGRLAFKVKDYIDKRFMHKFQSIE